MFLLSSGDVTKRCNTERKWHRKHYTYVIIIRKCMYFHLIVILVEEEVSKYYSEVVA